MVPTTEQVTSVTLTAGTTRSPARAAAEPMTLPATSGTGAARTTPQATSEADTEPMTGPATSSDRAGGSSRGGLS
jgi:hypothetical protein